MSTATLVNHATTVANLYDAFGRGDISFILDNLSDDCEWIGAGEGALPQGGTYRGKDAARFFQILSQNGDFNSFNPIAIANINDDEVVAFGDMEVTSKSTGKKMSSDWVMHWRFNDEGKVVYFHDFFDTAKGYLAEQKESGEKEQNISAIKTAFADFLKGNIQGILDTCTDDVEWGTHDNPIVPYGKTYKGKAGVADFFKTLSDTINYSRFEPREYYADADRVFVRGYHEATVKSTGKKFGHDFLMEFHIKGGKMNYFFAYVDTGDQAQAFQG
jgi:hypothetical protein